MGEQSQMLELLYGGGWGDGRRVPRHERKTHDLKALHSGHHEVINARLLGYSEREIADRTGYTTAAISLILNSRLAKMKLEQMRLARDGKVLDAAQKIQELVPKALEVYEEILNAEHGQNGVTAGLRKRTADVVVKDLAGLAAPKEIRVNGTMTHEVLARITERGIAAARECGLIASVPVDAELIDESSEECAG